MTQLPFIFLASIASLIAAPTVEVIGEFSQRPGNPAVGVDGTVYFSMHPFDQPEYKVMRLENGKGIPFPTAEISKSFAAVIGIQTDAKGRVWILDMGSADKSPQLMAWDTRANQLHQVISLPKEVTVGNSFIQDLAIDEKRGKAYLADMSRGGMIDTSEPAIIVVDLETGHTRRMLQGHQSFQPETDRTMLTEGTPATFADESGSSQPLQLGLNPIAIDAQNEWVYFSTVHPGTLYRIPAATLADSSKTDNELGQAIEIFAEKPTSDGIAADGLGNIYITNLEDNAISIADANGTRIWIQDERFIWPDGVDVAPDGSIVATVNQLNRAAPFNGGVDSAEPPYLIVRITK
jgi:sugar lactone lactonase YvrE